MPTVKKPKYSPGMMTTGELAGWRVALERAIPELPEGDSRIATLRERLGAVLAEQQAREKSQGIPANWAPSDGAH